MCYACVLPHWEPVCVVLEYCLVGNLCVCYACVLPHWEPVCVVLEYCLVGNLCVCYACVLPHWEPVCVVLAYCLIGNLCVLCLSTALLGTCVCHVPLQTKMSCNVRCFHFV